MIQIGYSELANQASASVSDYLAKAVKHIDEEFGKGYAKENPELVASFVRAAVLDFNCAATIISQQELTEAISIGISDASQAMTSFSERQHRPYEVLPAASEAALDSIDLWWLDCLTAGVVSNCLSNNRQEIDKTIGTDESDKENTQYSIFTASHDLYNSYSAFANSQRETPLTQTAFGRQFVKFAERLARVPLTTNSSRPIGYLVGDLKTARKRWCDVTGLPYDFDE